MRLYFAHAIPTYGTNEEAEVLKWFSDKGWLEYVINPADSRWQDHCCRNDMDYWRGLVHKCIALYFTRYMGHITSGVGMEIEAALRCGTNVIELVRDGGTFKKVVHQKCPKYLSHEATKRLIYPKRYGDS